MFDIGQRVVRSHVMESTWYTQLKLLKCRLVKARTMAPSSDGQDGQPGALYSVFLSNTSPGLDSR